MTAEWVGVIGVAIGASIGGIVTVASLVVRGRHEAAREERRFEHERETERIRGEAEEMRRSRDRRWDITLHGLEQRRDTYARLLRAVAEYDERMELLSKLALDRRTSGLAGERRETEKALQAIKDLVAEVEVMSQDSEVNGAVRQLITRGSALERALPSASSAEIQTAIRQVRAVVPNLNNICRWDLGLNAQPPDGQYEPVPYQPDIPGTQND